MRRRLERSIEAGVAATLLAGLLAPAGPAAASAAAPPRRPLVGRTIVLDPGHNGGNARAGRRVSRRVYAGNGIWKACNTTGTATAGGYPESAYNWDLSRRTAELLRARGARVVLTRAGDDGVGPCIDRRAAVGNRWRADLVLSVHADGNPGRRARGFHVIRSVRMSGGPAAVRASAALALVVRDRFAAGTGLPRSTYLGEGTGITPRRDIGGLNLSRRPAVLVETGNMRNPADARLLRSAAFREREALALADGMTRYLTR